MLVLKRMRIFEKGRGAWNESNPTNFLYAAKLEWRPLGTLLKLPLTYPFTLPTKEGLYSLTGFPHPALKGQHRPVKQWQQFRSGLSFFSLSHPRCRIKKSLIRKRRDYSDTRPRSASAMVSPYSIFFVIFHLQLWNKDKTWLPLTKR